MKPTTFADLPGLIEHRLVTSPRVLLVFLDAFGWRFLERHGDHPLLRGLDAVHPISSQFPSTTTAHVTTLHTGLPVGAHGLYEWHVLEPTLGRVITPLRSCFAGDRDADTLLAAGFDVQTLVPDGPSWYERLGVPSTIHQPAVFSPSTYDRVAARGAELRPYATLEEGVRDAVAALAAVDAGYAYVYFDGIDLTGHFQGPSSPEFDAAVLTALNAVRAGLRDASDLLVLLTADHGQVDVDPERTIWLDELHPPLAEAVLRPAGSARDVFLHVAPEDVDATLAAFDGHVEAHRTMDMLAAGAFGPDVSPRLLDRLAPVCVLPPPDRMAWVRAAPDPQLRVRGHHGGRTPEESGTWIGEWAL